MNNWLAGAAIASGLTGLLHVFGGGRTIVKPLLESTMEETPKYLNYYCWHIITMLLITMTLVFFYGSTNSTAHDLTLVFSLLSAGCVVWSLGLSLWIKKTVFGFPQWMFFLPIAVMGVIGSL